jgi:hypothetical protein
MSEPVVTGIKQQSSMINNWFETNTANRLSTSPRCDKVIFFKLINNLTIGGYRILTINGPKSNFRFGAKFPQIGTQLSQRQNIPFGWNDPSLK